MKKIILVTLIMSLFVSLTSESDADSASVNVSKILSSSFSSVIDSAPQERSFTKARSISSGVPNNTMFATLDSGGSAIERYFPMHDGDSKNFSWTTYNSTYTYSEVQYNGMSSYLEYDSIDGSKAYYGYSGDELVMCGAEAGGIDMRFDTPISVLNDYVLNNGGTIQDSTSFFAEGYTFHIDYKGTVTNIGDVTVPAGTFKDCRSISMEFSYRVEGESDSFDMEDVWILAPKVGKTKVAVADQFLDFLGWMELTSGTVGGISVADLANSLVPDGYETTDNLRIGAVINTVEKGPIEAIWHKGGEDVTSRGDRVIWGYFYASPSDVTWGSENNPDLFVKIWFDVSGRVDVNFFHVSVPDIEVYSDYLYDGTYDQQGTTTMTRRYIRQYYENGQSHSDENYEDGNPPSGYTATGNPSGYSTINDLRIGSIINTVEKGPIDAIWRLGGQDTTSRGDQVVWGHFYASPNDVTWGREKNPDLFVKIWFDVSGRVDVNFFHVSVPDIEVYSNLPDDGTYDQQGTTIMDNRYIRHEYSSSISVTGKWDCYWPDEVGTTEYFTFTQSGSSLFGYWYDDEEGPLDLSGTIEGRNIDVIVDYPYPLTWNLQATVNKNVTEFSGKVVVTGVLNGEQPIHCVRRGG